MRLVLQLGVHGKDNQMLLIGQLIMPRQFYLYKLRFSIFPTTSVDIAECLILFCIQIGFSKTNCQKIQKFD